jgi:hypothetical protein
MEDAAELGLPVALEPGVDEIAILARGLLSLIAPVIERHARFRHAVDLLQQVSGRLRELSGVSYR